MANKDRLVLRRRGYPQLEGKTFLFLMLVSSIPLVLLIGLVLVPSENDFITGLAKAVTKDGLLEAVIRFLFPVLAIVVMRIVSREKLILDETGIIYQNGIPEKYQFIKLDWQYRWTEITGAVFKPEKPVNPLLSRVILQIDAKTKKLVPWQWVDLDDKRSANAKRASLFLSKAAALKRVHETPLMQCLTARNIFLPEDSVEDPADTLNINRTAQVIAVLFVLAVFYFIGDVFFWLTEYFVPSTPWLIFALIGCLGTYIAYWLLRKEKLRIQDSAVMAVLFGVGIGLISYPLTIRFNAWADVEGLGAYTYVLGEGNYWIPANSGTPVLRFERASDYWAQFHRGEEKVFELRQGILGYMQINMAPIYKEQEKYYREKRENTD